MNKRRRSALLACAIALLLLASCGGGGGGASSSSGSASLPEEPNVPVLAPVEPEPEPEPELPYANPLTGEGLEVDISGKRPVAVMFNNLKKALPQVGVGQADVIYEVVAEGGITRMMGVFQTLEGVGELGSIRSARDYYVNLALGHDAIYIHAGGSPQAYDAFGNWGVTHIDFVNGPYGSMCWRDPERRKSAGLEHSLFTSGETVLEQMPSRFRLDHEADYNLGWTFSQDPPSGGTEAQNITVPFSKYKTGRFAYDPDAGQYQIEQHINGADVPYVDGGDGQAVTVRNVLVLYTGIGSVKGDDKGRLSVRTTGEGEGLLFRDGQRYEITWHREKRSHPFSFQDASGQPIPLGVGTSYINLVSTSAQVTWE